MKPVYNVTTLTPSESLPVDLARVKEIYDRMGTKRAEEVLCRGFERLAGDLAKAEDMYNQLRFEDMKTPLKSLKVNGQAVGLSELSLLAANVLDAIENHDMIATAATLMRCLRNSEPLLTFDYMDKSFMN